jgi:patatin-like phospholipase/acyl hydrolase
MQSNQHISNENLNNTSNFFIIGNEVWENLLDLLSKRENIDKIKIYIRSISIDYNIDKKNIIKDFLNYIIRNHSKYIDNDFLNFVENLMHSQIQNTDIYICYSLSKLSSSLSK